MIYIVSKAQKCIFFNSLISNQDFISIHFFHFLFVVVYVTFPLEFVTFAAPLAASFSIHFSSLPCQSFAMNQLPHFKV